MVETLILAAGSSATAAGTTAALSTAGGVATAAQVAGTGAFLSGAAASIGGSLLTGLSIASSISGGMQQNAIAKSQAEQYQLAARQETLKGREQADQIRRSLQATLASQNAAFSARGVALNSGTPFNIASQSMTQASRDIDVARFGAGQSAAALRAQGQQSKIEGRAAMMQGFGQAATSIYGARNSIGSLL